MTVSSPAASQPIEGIIPILVLPLDPAGRVDVDSLQSLIDFNMAAGVHGLGIAIGTEIFKLSDAERAVLTETSVARIGGRIPFIVNVAADGTDEAIRRARAAEAAGADALMAYPPVFPPLGMGPGVAHFMAIADAVSIPIILQDVAHAPISAALAMRLADMSPQFRHIKVETRPTVPAVAAVASQAGERVTVLGGDSGTYLIEEYRRGARGTMPFCSQPGDFMRVWTLLEAGDEAGARSHFNATIAPVNRLAAQQADFFYHVHKQILVHRGVIAHAFVKAPTEPVDRASQVEIDALLETLDPVPGG